MRCERADRVELDAFLLDPAGDPERAAFRDHYPHCADCAAAVAGWMDLEGALREVVAEAGGVVSLHPEPEDLALYVEARERLGERAMQIQGHLASCAQCGHELRLIEGFDPSIFAAAPRAVATPVEAPARPRTEPGVLESLREALVGFVEKLRGFDLLAPVPALALAAVVIAGLWLSGALDRFSGDTTEQSGPQLVEQAAPGRTTPTPEGPDGAKGSGEALPGVVPGAEAARDAALAERSATGLESAPAPAPDSEAAGAGLDATGRRAEPTPIEVAQAEPAPAPAPTKPATDAAPVPEPAAEAKPDEVLLAAVSALPPPDYASPEGGDSVVWMRQFGAVRSAPNEARVAARAPRDHTGLTLSSSPRLWWFLDQATDHPVQVTIVDGESIDPLVRVELPGPHAAGLHAFDLAKHGARLTPGVDYRWFVSIVIDPDRP